MAAFQSIDEVDEKTNENAFKRKDIPTNLKELLKIHSSLSLLVSEIEFMNRNRLDRAKLQRSFDMSVKDLRSNRSGGHEIQLVSAFKGIQILALTILQILSRHCRLYCEGPKPLELCLVPVASQIIRKYKLHKANGRILYAITELEAAYRQRLAHEFDNQYNTKLTRSIKHQYLAHPEAEGDNEIHLNIGISLQGKGIYGAYKAFHISNSAKTVAKGDVRIAADELNETRSESPSNVEREMKSFDKVKTEHESHYPWPPFDIVFHPKYPKLLASSPLPVKPPQHTQNFQENGSSLHCYNFRFLKDVCFSSPSNGPSNHDIRERKTTSSAHLSQRPLGRRASKFKDEEPSQESEDVSSSKKSTILSSYAESKSKNIQGSNASFDNLYTIQKIHGPSLKLDRAPPQQAPIVLARAVNLTASILQKPKQELVSVTLRQHIHKHYPPSDEE